MKIRLEFKIEDMWVGLFWRRKRWHGDPQSGGPCIQTDVWICLVPCLPIHITHYR